MVKKRVEEDLVKAQKVIEAAQKKRIRAYKSVVEEVIKLVRKKRKDKEWEKLEIRTGIGYRVEEVINNPE